MGNNSDKHSRKKHIYEELNKSIDSFTSCDNYSNNDDDNKRRRTKRKKTNNFKSKYKLKKHKQIINNKEVNQKLIESSLIISDFLINNIINKNIYQRPLPDTHILNSLLIFPDLFKNEALVIKNQKECCDQLIYNGLNNYKKEYKQYEINKKKIKELMSIYIIIQ